MIATPHSSWLARLRGLATVPIFAWRARRLAAGIYPELRASTRRKFAHPRPRDPEFSAYVQLRAAQLAHFRVDSLVREDCRLKGEEANRLLVRAAEIAAAKVRRDAPRRLP